MAFYLIVDPYRPQNILKRTLEIAFTLRGNGYHVEQLTIAQLRGDEPDTFRATRSFVDVAQSREQRCPS